MGSVVGQISLFDLIPFTVWKCIQDNLTECITNTLKHSDSNKFSLKIAVMITEIRLAINESNLNPSGACRIYAIAITKHTIAGANVIIKCFLFLLSFISSSRS